VALSILPLSLLPFRWGWALLCTGCFLAVVVAGSPFLFPYTAISSLIGPWLAGSYFLKDWRALLVWLSWWGDVVIPS